MPNSRMKNVGTGAETDVSSWMFRVGFGLAVTVTDPTDVAGRVAVLLSRQRSARVLAMVGWSGSCTAPASAAASAARCTFSEFVQYHVTSITMAIRPMKKTMAPA